ncbi:hypothetical protein EW026_g3183 [Hermanssonia centrifuga]|uniref:SUN domain-containing protein n=1 Tax=Hermanssonia centrifuga TaxID=98765 RepID=A0A4S4KKX5_9APHY|nr:hypothetical protein EW026_g3183 [Hermanssonia centrifuga]
MRSFFALPTPLLAFLFALPVLAEPLTPYDPFHNIAAQVPKPPELPICCLRPLAPLDGTEEEVLLSFEEWKAKRIAGVHKDSPRPTVHPPVSSGHSPGTSDMVLESPAVAFSATVLPFEQTEEAAPDAPYFRIPLTDRFNYASMDCSARVHTAHRTAKSTSSILSHKKDKYMLSPCGEKDQFVVVELCDDVRIDTVQLANYEFFSGVFKDFTVSVAKTYTIDPHGWTFAGTYRAKNVRGVQVCPATGFPFLESYKPCSPSILRPV